MWKWKVVFKINVIKLNKSHITICDLFRLTFILVTTYVKLHYLHKGKKLNS